MFTATIADDTDLRSRLLSSVSAWIDPTKTGPAEYPPVEKLVGAMAEAAKKWIDERLTSHNAGEGAPDHPRFPRPPPGVVWLRPKDAARAAGVSRSLIYEWMPRLVTRKVGGVRLILAASLVALEDVPSGRNGRPRRKATKDAQKRRDLVSAPP